MRICRATFTCIVVGLGVGVLMSCSGGYGPPTFSPATLTIAVSPTTITLGQSATITWTSNAPCTASGAWMGTKAASGNETVTPATTGTLTYTLICSGGGYRESQSRSATLTVTSAAVASLTTGNGCCNQLEPFPVIGITTGSGEDRFLLLGTHYVGKVGAAQTAYATCSSCLAGGPLKTDPNEFKLLAVTARASARASIKAPNLTSQPETVEFTVPYDQSFDRPSSAAAVQGVYTTNLGTGYTLTITVDSTGQVIGNDTNGCSLDGKVLASHPSVGYYDVVLDVNACGNSNGRYGGKAALIFDSTGRTTELFLSASSASAAIGWRLSR